MSKRTPREIYRDLSIGEVAGRSGVSASALRFYERERLIASHHNPGNQRRYPRDVLGRVAIIKVAQHIGIPLAEIRDAFSALPDGRTPTTEDWQSLSAQWRVRLDERITYLTRLRDHLGDCIGCGCLSLESCPLRNPLDKLSEQGCGARLLELS